MNSFETEWDRPEFDSVPSLAENAVYLLPECNDVILRKTLQEAYRDFCKRSAALRTWRRIPLEIGRSHYPVAPVLSGEVDCVTQVRWRHGREVVRDWHVEGDPPVLHFHRLFEPHDFIRSPNVAFVQTRPNVAAEPVLIPPEVVKYRGEPFSAWVEAVEVPSLNEERAPKAFLKRYGDAIVDGALVRLFSMSNRPWSDSEQARQRGIAYSNALSEARLRANRGGSAANASASPVLDMRSMV